MLLNFCAYFLFVDIKRGKTLKWCDSLKTKILISAKWKKNIKKKLILQIIKLKIIILLFVTLDRMNQNGPNWTKIN